MRGDVMDKYTVNLRYYTGDPLAEIRKEDLDEIGKNCGVDISFESIDRRVATDGMMREETLGIALEEISQDVITVASNDEASFRKAIVTLYGKYRSPRTPYSFWGSSHDGERIAKALADETGGGW
jgi:hypothetical protein